MTYVKNVRVEGCVVIVETTGGERVREQSATAILLAEILMEMREMKEKESGRNIGLIERMKVRGG